MRITLLTDNPKSWIVPFAQQLHDALVARGHDVIRCARASDIPDGDIACFLSCEHIVSKEILQRNRHDLVVHESALPAGKGFSPLTWQILEGKNEIPITLFEAVEALDAGLVYFQETLRFEGHELVEELRAEQGKKTVELLLRFIDAYPHVRGVPQQGTSTTYRRRTSRDSALDPHRSIAEQFNLLRVVDNERYPAYVTHRGHQYRIAMDHMPPSGSSGAPASGAGETVRTASPRTIAVLQARASSTRLPGKVLRPILGEPMLARQIERVRRSRKIDDLVVATSTEASDDAVVDLCERISVPCSRGSLTDVLDRAYRAVEPCHPSHVVRLTGDCPLTDPSLIDTVIDFTLRGDFDYATNAKPYTFPDGLDVEVVKFAALETAWREATLPSHREHVTPFVSRQPERFYLGYYRSALDQSEHRWTVDEPADFTFVSHLYEVIYPTNPTFTTADVFAHLSVHEGCARTVPRHERNVGRLKSLEEDARVLAAQHAAA